MAHLLGLIGFPLGHSFSQAYFSKKFKSEGITDWAYRNFELDDLRELPNLLDISPKLRGLNVTIPYKEQVLEYVDVLSPEARQTGAVNTLKIEHEDNKRIVKGYNTDVYGFEVSLKESLEFYHKKALILGTGGAAKAVAYVLEKTGITYRFVSRMPKNKQILSYEQVTPRLLKDTHVVINTTPLGMHPKVLDFPRIPYFALTSLHILFDLIYNPAETRFLAFGKQYGANTQNGLKMLQLQADKAWEIWTA